ncbi:hypothetical protein K1719_016556 [Acacia pycnantha]|nr:hypothetical protein K1719_016556 [Acacia pycnantha]
MAGEQANHHTLKELGAPDVNYQPLCIQYPDLAANFELKSGLIHLLPKFHGLAGECPIKHLKEFHVVCSTMKPHAIDENHINSKPSPILILFFINNDTSLIIPHIKRNRLKKRIAADNWRQRREAKPLKPQPLHSSLFLHRSSSYLGRPSAAVLRRRLSASASVLHPKSEGGVVSGGFSIHPISFPS